MSYAELRAHAAPSQAVIMGSVRCVRCVVLTAPSARGGVSMSEQIERIPQELLPHHAPRPRYTFEVEVHWVEIMREGEYATYYVHINEHLTQSRAVLVFHDYETLPDGVKRWLKEHKEVIERVAYSDTSTC